MRRIMLALQFLTIVPLKNSAVAEETEVAGSSSAFVIVGLLQGLLLTLVDYSARRVFDHDLVIGIVLLVLAMSSGGFHLDGLADTFDGLAAKGDRKKRLSVMKDSSVGPIGATAVFFVLLLKFLALKNLSSFSSSVFYSSLFLMPVFSKWAMTISMFHGKPAREEGLGRIFIGEIGVKEISVSTLLFLLSLFAVQAFFYRFPSPGRYFSCTVSAITLYLFCRLAISFFNKRFGGLTGDMLGSISEGSEIIFLFMGIAWSRFSI